jgi:hypothetical protein
MLRDPEFGPVRMRAFGTYVLKVKDPSLFIRDIVGTDAHFTVDEISNQLRSLISSRFADILAESRIPVLDLASNYSDLSTFITQRIAPEFTAYGLEMTLMVIENISLPPDVEEALDKRTSMGIIGDLNKYMQYQTANAMEKAAQNPGGDASAGIGMGMGFAMANQMGKMVQPPPPPGAPPPPVPDEFVTDYYIIMNEEQNGPFTPKIIREMIKDRTVRPDTLVWKQGIENWVKATELSELKELFKSVPPPVPR